MKIRIGPYPPHLTVNFYSKWVQFRYNEYIESDDTFEYDYIDKTIEFFDDGIQTVLNKTINEYFFNKGRKESIKIERFDTWSMDSTLAVIILPMLKQLKETKYGGPWVDNADVPEELRSKNNDFNDVNDVNDVDENWFKRWDYVLDAMIWSFEQKVRGDWMEDFYGDKDTAPRIAHQNKMKRGFELFGKYYENLWD